MLCLQLEIMHIQGGVLLEASVCPQGHHSISWTMVRLSLYWLCFLGPLPSGDFKAMSQHRGRAAFLLELIYRLIPAVL